MLLDFHSEIYSWIRGGLFVLFLYHLIIYFQNKNQLYLYYSLYLFTITLYLLQPLLDNLNTNDLFYANFSVQFLAYAAYVLFARELLDTRSHLIKWDRYFVIETKVLLILFPTFILIQFLLGYEFQIKAFTLVAPLLTIFTLISYYVVYTRIKDNFSVNKRKKMLLSVLTN